MVSLGPGLKTWQDENLEHLRFEYDLQASDYVVDVGSYWKQFADEIKKRYGCHVECFDAIDDRAAWLWDGKMKMGGQSYYTSLYDTESAQQEYTCVDIAKYLDREVALLKINIEGGEYELLNHIYDKCRFNNIRNMQIQFHQVDGMDWQTQYDAIAHLISYTHKLTWRVPFVWENWTRKPENQYGRNR